MQGGGRELNQPRRARAWLAAPGVTAERQQAAIARAGAAGNRAVARILAGGSVARSGAVARMLAGSSVVRSRTVPDVSPGDSVARSGAMAGVLARDGAGLLPGGRVHPAVESLIAHQRGGGHRVDERVRARIEPLTGDPLQDVRVHDNSTADALARSVQARAFTTGRDLFFARGEYRPGTSVGERLLAHELTHAAQQRGAATSGPLTVTEPGDRFERAAERTARQAGG